jgi:hypothetical protein
MIIGVLTILFILILVLSRGSADVYNQTSLINHRTHARFMAIAALEEMHDIVWNSVSNPIKSDSNRLEMLTSIVSGGDFEIDLHSKLKYAHKVERKQKKVTKERKKATSAILEATARFHNFQLIKYSVQQNIYANPTTFYTSPDGGSGGKPAAGQQGTHPDFFGWVTYKVKAQHGIVTKTVEQTRPVKVVTTTPMGKEYVVFEMEPSQNQSLNEGPGFFVQGNDEARIRIIGPYQLDVEGKKDGKAQGWMDHLDSDGGYSYPDWAGDKWYDDAMIPKPKGISTCPWFGTNGGRPNLISGGTVAVSPYIPLPCCPHPLALPIDYVAQFMKPDSQQWIAGEIDTGEQNFSLYGPDGDVLFKGLLYQNGGKYEEAQGITEDWDPDPEMEIRHEGMIIGNYKTYSTQVIKVTFPITTVYVTLYFCVYAWFGGEKEPIQAIYSLRGDEEPETDWAGVIIGGLLDVAGGLSMAGSMAGKTGIQAVGAVAGGIGKQLLAKKFLGGATTVGDGDAISPESIPNVFPEGFRMLPRAAVRHFSTLEEAMWKKDKLLLDGIFWVDDMVAKKDISYIGKGSLAMLGGPFSTAGEFKKVEPEMENRDFLNIFYLNMAQDQGLKVSAPYMKASVYSHTSIDPQEPMVLIGNLMTGTIRKAEMTDDLVVTYWNEKLNDISEEDYQKDFRVVSMSPKIEAYSEVSFQLSQGTGDDGIQLIVPTIGE